MLKPSKPKLAYREMLAAAQKHRCFYCDEPLDRGKKHRKRQAATSETIDHVFPKSKDEHRVEYVGGFLVRNVVLSCRRCNSHKGNRPPHNGEIERLLAIERFIRQRFPEARELFIPI